MKHKVMILSGMFNDLLSIIAERLEIDYVIGTKLEIIDNKYTGKIIPPLCFGENKVRLFKEFISEKKLNIDFRNSYAYADSIYDNPVFQMVNNPVATYPDKRLYKMAIDKRWKVIGPIYSATNYL
jgi:HAD superfamily phosphoserine phosphatase-like hydrolase